MYAQNKLRLREHRLHPRDKLWVSIIDDNNGMKLGQRQSWCVVKWVSALCWPMR